ncbi:MAG: sulfatase-like hydrolase/transferase, partial [Lentisphaerae bacterium]|nr:sulfatase-like hydrolase/transferase [Lentisphaerota bacterium]
MSAASNPTRPNIIIITPHDTGRHFGCYGVESVGTPAIDALAADGVRCTNLFATSTMCSPSRGSLLTGKYPERNGLMGLAGPNYRYELTRPREHLSHLLRAQGYQTVLCGHQHEAADSATLGFDETIREKPEGAVGIAAEVAAFLAQRPREEHRPFFLQIGFIETHTPYLKYGGTPDSSRGVWAPPYMGGGHDEAVLREHLAAFQGSIRQVDLAVAAILAALRAGGLEDNTLVLFTVDHGPELPRAKWTGFDAGAHVAGILRWPGGGLVGGRTCELLLNNT